MIANQISVRTRFGLQVDPTYVTSLASRSGLDTSYLGIPLTPAEVAEMVRRNRVGETFANVDTTLKSLQPDTYGGVWIDHQAGGVAVIASTSPTTISTATVSGLLPAGSSFNVVQVAVSLRRLDDLANRVLADRLSSMWAKAGVQITNSGTFPMENTTKVTLAPGSSQAAVQKLIDAYGASGLSVSIGPSPVATAQRYAGSGPLFGGMNLNLGCTVSPAAVGRHTGQLYGITAGHCGTTAQVKEGGSGGNVLGNLISGDNGFFNGSSSNCDCTDFGALPAGKATSSAIVNGPQNPYPDVSNVYNYGNWASNDGNYWLSRPLCFSGVTTNAVVCDYMQSVTAAPSYSMSGHTQTITNMIVMYCSAQGGDSGAPAGNGPTWVGIESAQSGNGPAGQGGCGNPGWQTFVNRVEYLPTVVQDTPNLPAQ